MKVMVLAGGPDKERDVSLMSGAQVTAALREAGFEVEQCDVGPNDSRALDHFRAWGGDVIFPILHGPWGEGGELQSLLDARGYRYVGSREAAARLCMDKHATKRELERHRLPTPAYELIDRPHRPAMTPPVVVKALREGSSFDLAICHDAAALDAAVSDLFKRHEQLLVEQFIGGREITVGVVAGEALPPIHIVPATAFYDFAAKYTRNDTQYRFDIDLPAEALSAIQRQAAAAHQLLGCRHLSRVDFMVDGDGRAWILEINTLPGFTPHSLVPMAARRAGLAMPQLVRRLVEAALSDSTA